MGLHPVYVTYGHSEEWQEACEYLDYKPMQESLPEGEAEVVGRDRFENDRIEIEVVETDHHY